jgi:integrase
MLDEFCLPIETSPELVLYTQLRIQPRAYQDKNDCSDQNDRIIHAHAEVARAIGKHGGSQGIDDIGPFISDSTIRFEMSIFGAIMHYAVKKRYVPASQRFDERPKLKTMRRDEFTLEEYRKLHTVGRKWIGEADKPSNIWYRTVTYNMILIACNTGMRPVEMKNLRWRDIMPTKDREGREMVVLFVQGKDKSRKLVAPKSVGDYLERIRTISKATETDDRVFTNVTGKPAKTLYSSLIEDLLNEANLREGTQGVSRSTYSFRHTYA